MKTSLNTSVMHEPNRTLRDMLFDASCRAIGRNKTKFFFKLYDLGRFDLLGKPKGAIGSIDVTNRCNLRCKHCYFYAHDYESQRELSDEEWISRLEELKQTNFPFYQCSWVGGEPLLRRELIELGMKYFKSNLVATNGTLELPNWQDVNFYISIDGPQEMHDAIRGKGCYTRIRKNIARPDLKILVSMVITRMNYQGIERFLEEWRETTVKGCLLQFYTAVRGLDNDDLWLNWDERDAVIDKLIRLKEEKYGNFIGVPTVVLQLMKSSTCREITRNCLYRQEAFCLDPQGRVKKPCMIGPLADCERCGCVVPFHLKALESKKLMLRELFTNLKRRIGKRALT